MAEAAKTTSGIRSIMYVGKKPRTSDRVNENPGRVWNGLGDIVPVSAMDALKLKQHADIWVDVTDWPEARRISKINQIRETLRLEARKNTTAAALAAAQTLDIEELESIIRERRKLPTIGSIEGKDVVTGKIKGPEDDDLDPTERPTNTKEVVEAIVGAIMTLDPDKPEFFDQDGNATIEAVSAALGWNVTDLELAAAMRHFAPQE